LRAAGGLHRLRARGVADQGRRLRGVALERVLRVGETRQQRRILGRLGAQAVAAIELRQ
jgi:hypothetical protein